MFANFDMAAGEPLPAGFRFSPNDEDLIRYYSDPNTGFSRLIGIIPTVQNLYRMNPVLAPPPVLAGEGARHETEDNGLQTITTNWLVLTTRFSGQVSHVRDGYWRRNEYLTQINSRNRTIGFNQVVRFYERGETRSFWTAVEVISPASATTVVCRLTSTEILPTFDMDERDAALSLDELLDGDDMDEDDPDLDG